MDQTQQIHRSGMIRTWMMTILIGIFSFISALTIREHFLLFGYVLLIPMAGLFAVLYLTVKTPLFPILSASCSMLLLQLFGGFAASFGGVIFLISALALAFQVRDRVAKTSALVTTSLILGGGFLILGAISYAVQGGSLAPSDLLEEYHAVFRELKILAADQVRAMVDQFDENMLAMYAEHGITKSQILESNLRTMESSIDLIELIFPAVLVFILQFCAYLEIVLFRFAARAAHVDALLPAPKWSLMPTQISCIFFIIVTAVYIIGSFFAEDTSVFMVITANLWIILLPCMLLCGVHVLYSRLRHPMYRIGTCMTIAVFVLGLFFLPSVALQLAFLSLSFLGAQTVFAMHTIESDKHKKQK